MVEDYVMDLKKRVNPNSVPTYLYAIQAFLEASDIDLKWKKIRRLYPAKVKLSGAKAYTTNQIQKMLSVTPSLRNKSIIHFLAASGARVGSLPDMKLRSLSDMPEGCKSVLVYESSIEEYTTFIHFEAARILEEYFEKRRRDGEILTPDSPIFREDYKLASIPAIPLSRRAIINMMERVVKNAGIRGSKKGTRYDIQLDHGLRKRWNTILKTTENINIILVEKMFGHSTPTIPLDKTYMVASSEILFKEYKKAIPFLTISDDERQKQIIQDKDQKISKLEKKEKRISELEFMMRKKDDEIDDRIQMKTQEYTQKFLEDIKNFYEGRLLESNKRLEEQDRKFVRMLEKDIDKEFVKSEKFKQLKKILYED